MAIFQHGEWKLFRVTVDWQYDNCSLKVDDSYGIIAQCTTQDEWVLQVLPEWARFHKDLYQPQINTCQFFFVCFFFATSANVACLYKPKCYQWPQSASVMCLLSGLAAAVKCQLKCQEGSRQRLGRRNGQMPMAGQVGADVTLSPEPQEVCFWASVLARGSVQHIESHWYGVPPIPTTPLIALMPHLLPEINMLRPEVFTLSP